MSKATTTNVRDEGFRAVQFGGAFADDAAFNTYLSELLTEAENWLKAQLGAAIYDAATAPSYGFDCLKRAELCFVSGRLWKRRAAFLDSQGNTGLQQSAYLERREYLAHAQSAADCAGEWLAKAAKTLGVDIDDFDGVGGFATGYIETGPFPQSSAEPLNG